MKFTWPKKKEFKKLACTDEQTSWQNKTFTDDPYSILAKETK